MFCSNLFNDRESHVLLNDLVKFTLSGDITKQNVFFFLECENSEFIQTEAVERFHQLLPHDVRVEFDKTNITLSMHSQKK